MVRLSIWCENEPRKIALRDAIRFELETQHSTLSHKRLKVEIDLSVDVGQATCTAEIRNAIETVLGLAIDRSPRGGLLSVVGCTTERGIELEIADEGDERLFPRFAAFRADDCGRFISAPGKHTAVSYYGAPCPQGGMAWTIVIRPTKAIAKAA